VNHLLGIRFFFLIDWLEEYWLKESVGAAMVNPERDRGLGLCGFEQKYFRKQFGKDGYPIFTFSFPLDANNFPRSIGKLRWWFY